MASTLAAIREQGLIAVMEGAAPDRVFEWAMAVSKGGIELLAIPAQLPNVTELVSDLDDVEGLVVGICGVLQPEDVSIAVAAGGEFVITPVVDEAIVTAATSRGLVTIVGATTPSEVHRALALGADLVSVHPAGAMARPDAYFKSIARTFPGEPLAASGCVDVETATALLEAGAAAALVDRGVFPDSKDPEAADIITMRAIGLVEVCAEVLGMPKRSSFTDLRQNETPREGAEPLNADDFEFMG